jgi:CoA:oxalate CoA-transferase
MATTALDNIRVLDISDGISGAYCTKYLADYGADVIKIEEPNTGNTTRHMGPFFHDEPHREKSLLYFYLNCNKRSVTLDISKNTGKKIFLELLVKMDVLVENFQPGYLEQIGLTYEELKQKFPNLIILSLSSFGQTGPRSSHFGNDLIYYAMSGIMHISGAYGRSPLKHGHPQSYYMAGMTAAYTVTAALFSRLTNNSGQQIDVSLQEVSTSHHYNGPTRYSYTGAVESRATKIEGSSFKGVKFEGIVKSKDGYIGASSQQGRQRPLFSTYAEMLDIPELSDEKFSTNTGRIENAQELDEILLPILEQWNKYDYFDKTMSEGWVTGVVQTPEDLLNCPQLKNREYFIEVEHPIIGKITIPGEIFRLPNCPWKFTRTAPLLGQHNTEIYCQELNYNKDDVIILRQGGII